MKKILLMTAFVGANVTAAANDFVGLSMGVQASLSRTDYKQKLDSIVAGTSANAKVKKPTYTPGGEVFLAYANDCDKMHYGAKLAVGMDFAKREKNVSNVTGYSNVKASVKREYTISLTGQLGGYVSDNMIIYGLAGIKRVRYGLGVKAAGGVDGTVGKTLFGPIFGVGTKTVVAKDWVLNTELSYEMYRGANTGNVNKGSNSIGTKIKPNVLNLTLGLSHKF